MSQKFKEHSAGAVVFSDMPERKYLVIRHKSGHWSFPKGHLEAGEDSLTAAHREILEETNLLVNFIDDFHRESHYFTRRGLKLVDFYLAEARRPDKLRYQRAELCDARWLELSAAQKLLTFPEDRKILADADLFLESLN
ncbi:MAG: NUDIX domain-containing protein [Eubacteriales bacterium]|nr:NUDIX domain-containing protein [Eubacteriales bacterium]